MDHHVTELCMSFHLLSIEWNLIRPGGPAHGIVTKTVHKTLLGGEGAVQGVGGCVWVGVVLARGVDGTGV